MGNYLSSPASGKKRNHNQAELDDTDDCDDNKSPRRKKLKSTSKYIYETLFVGGENSDVTIAALGHEWRLHKIYLCQSGFFSSMFSGSWKESSMNRIDMDIPDEHVTEAALTIAFGSLYRDDILIDPSTVAGLLAAASLLSLDDLIQQCADVMRESIDVDTVCSYYMAGRLYGAKDVPEKCIKYLQATLMPNMTMRLLKDIDPDLMMKLVQGSELFVLQVEMDVYSMLRKWLFLRLNPNYEGTLKDLVGHTDAFIKSEVASNWQPSFLETQHGAPYVEVFKKLRIEYIVTDHSSAAILERDGILPQKWVLNFYRSQWLHLLKVDNGNDIGPKDLDVETFETKSMRCGRRLDTEGQYCWRWTGFNYGIDILVTCSDHRILLKRNTPTGNCHCVVAPQVRRNIIYRLTVTAVSSADDKPPCTSTTGIKQQSLRKDEEVCVLTLDRKFTYPLYISCNFLLYTPEPATAQAPPVVDMAAAANSQPLAGPSAQNGMFNAG